MFKKYALMLSLLSANAFANVILITPSDVTSSTASSETKYNNVSSLIENATDINYLAPNPSSGGGGTSTWTDKDYNTWTFTFNMPQRINSAFIWDYYTHSSTEWIFNIFDNNGKKLGSHAFSFDSVAEYQTSKLHSISFATYSDVSSITLTNTNLSERGGVGLSELHFANESSGQVATVSEPSTFAIMGLGVIGLMAMNRRRKNKLSYSTLN